MRTLSTSNVAKLVEIHPITLERWLADGKIPAPKPLHVGGRTFRHWTREDVARVKQYKAEHYWEGRGPKPKKRK
jgi:excisionase family DNA binding protein